MKKINIISKLLIIATIINVSCDNSENKNREWPPLYDSVSSKQITNTNSTTWDFHPRWSNDGNKIAFARYNSSNSDLALYMWDKITSTTTEILSGLNGDCSISWNPDDTKVAIDIRDENDISQIYIVNILEKTKTKFTTNSVNSFRPDWSSDGNHILYVESNSITSKAIDGSSTVIISETENGWNPSWSQDDSKIIFSKNAMKDDIYCINSDGTELMLLASGNSLNDENWARWLEGTNKIIYQLFKEGISKIVLKDLINDEQYLLTDIYNCRFPDCSPDGNSIVFSYEDNLWILTNL